jgi:hypothetical protein
MENSVNSLKMHKVETEEAKKGEEEEDNFH